MPEITASKYLVQMECDEAPHLSHEERQKIWDSTEPHLREARFRGIPSMGSGAIYPIAESEITVNPFEIPDYWPRAYGMDVGWRRTAAVWGAQDRQSGVVYLYNEYYRAQAEPAIHARGIRSRGDWIPGTIDPAAAGASQRDGRALIEDYQDLGLDLVPADNTLTGDDSGINRVWQMLSSGQLKVFSTLQNWLMEFRLYRRDEKGKIVKDNDHLMDATRYLMMTGMYYAIVKPKPRKELVNYADDASRYTGY